MELSQKDGLFAVEQACFGDDWTREMLFEEIENPLSVLVTEQQEGAVAGFALGRVVADEGELFQIGVLPEFRKRGIAVGLLSELLGKMSERGAAKCFLEVRSRNAPAIALYEKCGFQRISVRRGYYSDDDALIYCKNLSQHDLFI